MPTSETRIKPNHIALNGAPALTAAYVPTNAGTIEVSNRIAWEARIHSTIAIGGPRAKGPKRVPSAGLVAVVSFSRTHDARCSVFWIPLSGFALFPPRGEGVSPEAVLLHAEADSCAPVLDLGARARDPQRPHPGRDRRGDAFGSHDRHEVAHPNGVDGPGRRRTGTRAGPPGSLDGLPSEQRGLASSDEAPDAAPGRHCRSAGPRARPDAYAGRRDSRHLPGIREPDRRGLARATGMPRLHEAAWNRVRRDGSNPLGRHVAAPRPRVRADRGVPDPRRLGEFVLLRPRRFRNRGNREEHTRRKLARASTAAAVHLLVRNSRRHDPYAALAGSRRVLGPVGSSRSPVGPRGESFGRVDDRPPHPLARNPRLVHPLRVGQRPARESRARQVPVRTAS